MKQIHNKNYFSLMELMVVFAIIAILVSFLIPGLGKAREQARLTQCLSQEKQIAIATLLSVQDNKGYFPAAQYKYGWDDQIVDYLGLEWSDEQKGKFNIDDAELNRTIFLCPSDNIAPRSNKFRRSYAANAYQKTGNSKPGLMGYMDNEQTRTAGESMKLVFVTQPSRTIMFGEKWDDWNLIGSSGSSSIINGWQYQQLKFYPSGAYTPQLKCHFNNGTGSFVYADGSAASRYGGNHLEGSPNYGQTGTDFRGSWFDSQQ